MRTDVFIEYVEKKCDVLSNSRLWSQSPKVNPRVWMRNFDLADKEIAALLLDRFVFCNDETVDLQLLSAWNSIADGYTKGPEAPNTSQLLSALSEVVFTPVEGERPNPADSGNLMCRKARQVIGIPEELVKPPAEALEDVQDGKAIVFLDDFVGSGDQFLETWKRDYYRGKSFSSVHKDAEFVVIYVTLISTSAGLKRIHEKVPSAAVCTAHIIEERSNLNGLFDEGLLPREDVVKFLEKYSSFLRPHETYIANNPEYLKFGYKKRGLFLGFEHSVPDATLPIFWSPGVNDWEPLIERN